LSGLPLYFACAATLVLDATSMLFLLVINAVFLGISVYMSSRVSTSQGAGRSLLPRAGCRWPSWWP
jgi:hydrogenase-4 component F